MNPKISKETIKRAIALARSAVKLGFTEPQGIVNEDHGDSMTYIFSTKDSMVMICCSPTCYLVSHGKKNYLTVGGAEFLIVANLRQFLQTLKKKGYKSPSRAQLKKWEDEVKRSRRKEREPNDDELKDIENDEGN